MAKLQNLDVILSARGEEVAYESVADDSYSISLSIADLYKAACNSYSLSTPDALVNTLDSMTEDGFTPDYIFFNPFQRVKAKRVIDKDTGVEDMYKSVVKTVYTEPQLYTKLNGEEYTEVYTTAKYTMVKKYKRKGQIEKRTVVVGYDFRFKTLVKGAEDDIIIKDMNGIAINAKGGFPSLSWGFRQAYKAAKDVLVRSLQNFGLAHNQNFLKLKVGIGSRYEVVGG